MLLKYASPVSTHLRCPGHVQKLYVCSDTLLQEQQLPDLNIICEKLAFEGVTRFEDRYRLPVSISVNCTAYAAKLLAEVGAHGRSCELKV